MHGFTSSVRFLAIDEYTLKWKFTSYPIANLEQPSWVHEMIRQINKSMHWIELNTQCLHLPIWILFWYSCMLDSYVKVFDLKLVLK